MVNLLDAGGDGGYNQHQGEAHHRSVLKMSTIFFNFNLADRDHCSLTEKFVTSKKKVRKPTTSKISC